MRDLTKPAVAKYVYAHGRLCPSCRRARLEPTVRVIRNRQRCIWQCPRCGWLRRRLP